MFDSSWGSIYHRVEPAKKNVRTTQAGSEWGHSGVKTEGNIVHLHVVERAGTHSSVLMLPCWEDHFLLTVRTNNVIDKQHGTGIKLSPCVVNQSVSQAQNCPKCEDPRLTPCVARTCYLSPHNVQCWLFIIVLPVDRPGTGGGYHTGLVASNILYTQHTSLPCLHPACTECIRSIGKTSAPTNRIRRRLRLADWPGLHLGRTNERSCYIVWSRVDGWHVTRYPGCWRPHLGIRILHNTIWGYKSISHNKHWKW